MRNLWKYSPQICLALAMTLLTGCGQSGVEAMGEVTYNGRPVDEGSIVFEPADGVGPAIGGKISDGKYEMKGENALTPGKKNVKINAIFKTGKKVEASRPAPPGTMIDEIERVNIPPQTADVEEGKVNEIPFRIEGKEKLKK